MSNQTKQQQIDEGIGAYKKLTKEGWHFVKMWKGAMYFTKPDVPNGPRNQQRWLIPKEIPNPFEIMDEVGR
jgi:hypothetical protein